MGQQMTLDEFSGLVADQMLDLDATMGSRRPGHLTLEVLVQRMEQRLLIRSGLLRKRFEVPLDRYAIEVAHVDGVEVFRDQGIGFYTICGVSPGKDWSWIVATCESTEIRLRGTGIDFEVRLEAQHVGVQQLAVTAFIETLGPVELRE